MNGDLTTSLLWVFLTLSAVLFTIIFSFLFRKDRDKRKLMFMLSFGFASLTFLSKIQPGLESSQVIMGLYYWGSLPTLSAVFIAVLSSLLDLEDFEKSFKAFLLTLAASIILIAFPIPVQPLRSILFQISGMFVIITSIYLILARKETSDAMFLFSMICFVVAGLGMAKGSGVEFTVFAYIFAYVFIGLVFATSRQVSKGGISSFFALRRELEKTRRERIEAEEALYDSEEKFRAISTRANDAIVLIDHNEKITYWNPAAEKMFGYKNTEVIGKKANILFDSSPAFRSFIKSFQESKKKWGSNNLGRTMEYKARRKAGEGFPIELSLSVLHINRKWHVLNIVRDISLRKKLENELKNHSERLEDLVEERTKKLKEAQVALQESQQRLRQLIEFAPDAIYVHDLKGSFITGNRQAELLFGYKKDELIGKSFQELNILSREYLPQAMKLLTENKNGRKTGPNEFQFRRKNRKIINVEISSFPVKNKGKVEVISIARDLTERKKMENRILRSERLAAVGEMATMVGHDLRNPLQSIENATYYLNNELPRFSQSNPNFQTTMRMLKVISDSVEYADKITRDLKYYSSTSEPELKMTDINSLIDETIAHIETPENVNLLKELESLPEIDADPSMIKRVFVNLLINGFQAMEEKGGTLKISSKKEGSYVKVSFKDNGVGINKEVQGKIFIPFYSTKAKGMGMGLAICKKFIESHHGDIEVESKEGKGSTFTLKLPIKHERR